MNVHVTMKDLLNDGKSFVFLSAMLLIGDGILSLVLLLLLRAWELEAALYLFRSVYLVTGALGLFVGAILLISGRYQQRVVQDRRYAAHFRHLPFLCALLSYSVILILAGCFFDFVVRGL